MKKNHINDPIYKYNIDLYSENQDYLGAAKLAFGGNHWPTITFSSGIPSLLINECKANILKAFSEDGKIFSLFDCKINNNSIYVGYVIEDDLSNAEFDSISVRYSDVSEWFLNWQNLEGDVGEIISWENIPKKINVKINTANENFDLESEYISSRRKVGEDIVLHEHIEFLFSATTQRFTPVDVKEKTNELACLFSLLLGMPISILSIMISTNNGKQFSRVHFPTFESRKRDLNDSGFWLTHLIQQPKLESLWQSVISKFYDSKYRKVCWTRLAGMLRYEGFWEYKALGYVSLLDNYLNLKFERAKRPESVPPSQKRLTRFKNKLSENLLEITPAALDKIIEVASQSFASDAATFGDKYRMAMDATDPDIIKIISLSDDDFELIKAVRNKIAHGDDHGLKNDEFATIMKAEGKITLLLTYWAFLDFGINKDAFIDCLKNTHSKIKFSASIDNIHLSRLTGTAEFLPTTLEKFQVFQSLKNIRFFACFIQDDNGEITFSEKLTKIYEDWRNDSSKTSGVQSSETIFGVPHDKARVIGHGYFECNDKCFPIYNAWIIKSSGLK